MDIDIVEESELQGDASKSAGKKPVFLPVDDAHPLDVDGLCSGYSGRSLVERLLQIISSCPAVAVPTLRTALQTVKKMRDIGLYKAVLSAYEQTAANSEEPIPPLEEIEPLDQKWIDDTTQKNQVERNKLEVELKTYSSNMIKESIRMAYRDLGDHCRTIGDHSNSLKHYTKSREFCTTGQHVLDMCLSILELLMEYHNYPQISTYVFKADAALDATPSQPRNTGPTAPASAAKEKVLTEREKVQSKLDAAMAISHLGQGQYEKAAVSFLKVGPIKTLGDWAYNLISPADIAVYTTLCALATFTRPAIKAQVLDNENVGLYIEQEPYVRELIDSYMSNRFKEVLALLERYSTRHLVDVHLSAHIASLTSLIRDRALVLYFQPFASIKLERMSAAFGWSVEELEQHVVALIQTGQIKARVDRQNKILKAKETDQRAALFARVIKSGENMQSANRRLLLRMRLQQADLIVKAPRSNPMAGNDLAIDMYQY